MRILLYAGKGGVGKTSVAGATGVITARQGLKTIVLSLDPAHSLSDAFDLEKSLMDKSRGMPVSVSERLWIQELDVHEEIGRSWGEVHKYISVILNISGIDDILAEELAILPGMEEISALLYVNHYVKRRDYDLIILDCAPTAESIRFVSIPKTLEWYMRKIFRLERRLVAYARPIAKRLTDVPLPEDEYFSAIEKLFECLRGVDDLLRDPKITTVRLVTCPEKMVLCETQRAFMFFSLHQLSTDAIIVNRVFPAGSDDRFVPVWEEFQSGYMDLAESYFHPVPIFTVRFYPSEMIGYERLLELGLNLYSGTDPAKICYFHRPIEYIRDNGRNLRRLHVPFVTKAELELTKIGEELIIRVGNFQKSIILPRSFALLEPGKARLEDDFLTIDFGGGHE